MTLTHLSVVEDTVSQYSKAAVNGVDPTELGKEIH
jgi:hypothetical protein